MEFTRVWITGLVVLVLIIASAQTDDDQDSTGGRRRRRGQNQQQQQSDEDDGNNSNDDDDSSGGRRRGGRRKNKGGDADITVTWKQLVGDAMAVTKSLEAPASKPVIVVESKDKALDDLGFVESTTTYDYTTETAAVAINTKGRGPCFLTNESQTYQEIVDGAIPLTGTLVAQTIQITLDGTGAALSKDEEDAIFASNPEIKQACGRGNIVMLVQPGGIPPPADETKEVKVLTYDAELTIIAPSGRRAAAKPARNDRVALVPLDAIIGFASNQRSSSQRNRRPKDKPIVRFTWLQDLGSGQSVNKSAVIFRNSPVITLLSRDADLFRLGFETSTTTYDYTTGSGVVVMRTRFRGPCYLTDEALTYTEIVNGATQLNGTLAPPSIKVTLDGTGPALPTADVEALFRANPGLARVCGRGIVIPTAEPGVLPPYIGFTTEIKLLTFDGEITIITRGNRHR